MIFRFPNSLLRKSFIPHPSSFILLHFFILQASADDTLTFHQPPKPLAENAVTEPWTRFLGPHDNATSNESPLAKSFPDSGPPLVWERNRGTGYAGVAAANGHLIQFHRLDDRETVESLHPETGQLQWTFDYPVKYRDRYGYSNGPRAGPVIDGDRVYTFGVTGILHCADLATGKILWKRDLKTDFAAPQNFFGSGSSPLVLDDKLIVNIGGDACVVALNKTDGKRIWSFPDKWHAGYASPVVATFHGKQRLLIFTGGESDPAIGGLLCVDPETGEVNDRFPWRADIYESVIASTPVPVDGNRVYISECYQNGGVMLSLDENFKFKIAWKAADFGMHWMTPLLHEGHLYGFRGRNEPDAFLACYNTADGTEKWRETLTWKQPIGRRTFGWGFFRATMLRADGLNICLGELGTLALIDLSPSGASVTHRASLFAARSTWTLPALHKGLLYITQNEPDLSTKKRRRLLCYDLRGQ